MTAQDTPNTSQGRPENLVPNQSRYRFEARDCRKQLDTPKTLPKRPRGSQRRASIRLKRVPRARCLDPFPWSPGRRPGTRRRSRTSASSCRGNPSSCPRQTEPPPMVRAPRRAL
eukprot:1433027-Pyramimonas_sp.AAC.1